MTKKLEETAARLEALKGYRAEVIAKSRAEAAKAQAEIDRIEAELADATDLEDYKDKQQDLKDARACLAFIKNREEKLKGPILDDNEMKSIRGDVFEEIEIIQEKHAPAIKKKLLEAVALMDAYSDEVTPLEKLMESAYKLNNPVHPAQCIKKHEISDQAPDARGVWTRFVYMYYKYFFTNRR